MATLTPITNGKERRQLAIVQGVAGELRQRRLDMGMSQEALAERCGLHRTYVSDVERGLRNVSLGALSSMCEALEVPLWQVVQHAEQDRVPTVHFPVDNCMSSLAI